MGIDTSLFIGSKAVHPFQLFRAAQEVIAARDPRLRRVEEHVLDWPYASRNNGLTGEWMYVSLSDCQDDLPVLRLWWNIGQGLGHLPGGNEGLPPWRMRLSIGSGKWSYIADIGEWLEGQDVHWWWVTDADHFVHEGKNKIAVARGTAPYPAR